MSTVADSVCALTSHLLERDTTAAVELVSGLVDEAVTVQHLLACVVGPAQVEVGERWYRNEISVADEHAATAIADAVVSLVTLTPRPAGPGPRVVVACAEGEWHVLAARMFAEVLRAEGCTVTFLGPSLPADHLLRFLKAASPDVVALSCTTPLAFQGLLWCTEAAHSAGVPVLAGGRALGNDDWRARVLGVDLWAGDAAAAAGLVRRGHTDVLRCATADTQGAIALALQRDQTTNDACQELFARFPGLAPDPRQQERTREDFAYILQFAEAAVLTRDDRVLSEFLAWLSPLLTARGLPASTLDLSLDILDAVSQDEVLHDLLGRVR